ncbi:MAG: TonB-dependent receptor [Cyclonatronaceae bacterium]
MVRSRSCFDIPILLTSALLFLTATVAHAQTVQLRGIITDASDNQPVEGANVVLLDREKEFVHGAATDRNGLYRIGRIQPGDYYIRISYIGYVTHEDPFTITDEPSQLYNARLEEDREMLDEVVISVRSQAARMTAGHQRVSPVDLQRVVTPGAGGDMASYLQALPGVVATGDRGGQLFVRGGTPSENLALIDGLTIYQPFHIVGFFSAFPQELLASADFYAGGFETRYTGRISSVLDVRMRDGNFHNTTGSGSISPFLTEVLVEGPLQKGHSSWIGSYRRSQIEHTSPLFLGKEQPVHFESQFAKVTQLSNDGTRCSALGMHTYDRGRLDSELGNNFWWRNLVIGGGCTHIASDPDLFVDFNTGISHLSNGMGGSRETNLSSSITKLNTELNISQFVDDIELRYGINFHMKWLTYDIEELFQVPSTSLEALLGLNTYIESAIPIGNVMLRPGTAFTYYTDYFGLTAQPRLRFSWQPYGTKYQEFNAAIGYYSQSITGITDLRDVGTAFLAWLPAPEGKQLRSLHYLVGWQQRLARGLQVSVEGYHKQMKNLPVTVWSTIAKFTTDLALADGNIYGADLRFEYGTRRLYTFIGYGYSWIEYESAQRSFSEWFGEPIQHYHPAHDRRHQINAMVTLDVSDYTFSVGWQLGTGLPFTRQMGFDSILRFDRGLPNVRSNYGTPRVILDQPFQGRTPVFHRMDISVNRTLRVGTTRMEIQLGVINSYNRTNLFYYDVYTQRRIDQLPLAPYGSFKVVL